MSCACARVHVTQPIVNLHFCRWGFWKKRRVHLGRQEEAFDAEMYAMLEAMKIADEIAETKKVRRVMVFMDSQATLRRIQSDEPGPGQVLALRTMNWVDA